MTPDPQATATREAYDQWHAKLDVDALSESPWHVMVKAKLIPDRDLVGRRVLEIGCGRGGMATWLATGPNAPAEMIAADFSPTAVEKAAKFAVENGVSGIRWEVADIQKLEQFTDGEFDTVISCETIEHVPDPPLAVRQLARVLKPGGRLFLTTPNYFSTIGLYRVYCWVRGKTWDEGGQPIVQWTMLHKTRRWVKAAGLTIIEAGATGQYLPFPGRRPFQLDLLEHPRFLMKWVGHHSMVIGQKP
jgi:2-polyprenyl-3-methyl-5-hydroxy-6-metoxy-1,4-benzoquinol methylase